MECSEPLCGVRGEPRLDPRDSLADGNVLSGIKPDGDVCDSLDIVVNISSRAGLRGYDARMAPGRARFGATYLSATETIPPRDVINRCHQIRLI